MVSRLAYYLLFASFLFVFSSCTVKRKEYIERNGLHSDQKPSEMAKEIGAQTKKQNRAYKKEQRKAAKAIKKRNKKRIKGEYFSK